MARYKLTLEYDGTPFVGWQVQDSGLSVQEVLETAIKRLCGCSVRAHCAGRTDAGVHATGQVAHCDLPKDYPAHQVQNALNYHMKPHPVAVTHAEIVSDDFHARFSAIERRYLYRIIIRTAPLVLERNRAWRINHDLDARAMHDAAQILLGQHDFSTFRAQACQAKSPIKTLDQLDVTQIDNQIEFKVRARSFLHHQVRNIVGSLKLVGEGKWIKQDLQKALDACDRRKGGPTVPAKGLYLTAVIYYDE
ncbi:MAG: tRNA pseudouridine(38-40) synthase TruA [Pseudomonadota bacterium]